MGALERSHSSGKCFRGFFGLPDMLFNREHSIVEVNSRVYDIDFDGYVSDWTKVKSIVKAHFIYRLPNGQTKMPIYMHNFIRTIEALEFLQMDNMGDSIHYTSWKRRSLRCNHCFCWPSSKRIGLTYAFKDHLHGLLPDGKILFQDLLGESSCLGWISKADNAEIMHDILVYHPDKHKRMGEQYALTHCDFQRCLHSHGTRAGRVTALMIDAVIGYQWPNMTPSVHRNIILGYSDYERKIRAAAVAGGLNAVVPPMESLRVLYGHAVEGTDLSP